MGAFSPRIAGAALAAALALAAGRAEALSLGIYGSAGGGVADWERDRFSDVTDRRDTEHVGYGFVLDASTPRSPLAYRASLGYERIRHEAAPAGPRYTMRGFVLDQDLTLDIAGGWPFRLWLGPELRLAYLRGKPDGAPAVSTDFAALGIGPVLGVDYQVGPSLALSWKLGYLVTGYASGRNSESWRRSDEPDITIGAGHAYLAMAILFRTWGYPQPQPPAQPQPPQPAPYPWQRY